MGRGRSKAGSGGGATKAAPAASQQTQFSRVSEVLADDELDALRTSMRDDVPFRAEQRTALGIGPVDSDGYADINTEITWRDGTVTNEVKKYRVRIPTPTAAESADFKSDAIDKLKTIKSGTRKQTINFTNPKNGHPVEAYVEKVTHRDYWGRSLGRSSYTVYVTDQFTGDRLYYNYGVDGLKKVKDSIRSRGGID